jgi:excisionase family DNA binding protein
MAKRVQAKELFTASEVARFCQVDLKTIHNWADRGEVRHFRTPGRHLRFRRADVLDFLRKYGYPVPDVLRQGKPSVHVVEEDAATLAIIERVLSGRVEVTSFSDPVDALVAIGSLRPDVIVLDTGNKKLDAISCIARLKSMEATRYLRVVVCSPQDHLKQACLDAGATSFIARADIQKLPDVIDAMMGTER